jgi:type IV pilus assembly protein PilC
MTKILLAIGDIFSHYKYLIIVGLLALPIGLKIAFRTRWFKNIWDRAQLKIPVFGRFYHLVYNERYARTLSSLIMAGLPMLEILKTCRRVIANGLYQVQLDQVITEVETGSTLSAAMKKQRLFPSIFGNMIASGEKTGSTGQVVAELASFYEREIDQMAKNFTTLIEPVMMVIIGVGVGFMVASVILPIYNLISTA